MRFMLNNFGLCRITRLVRKLNAKDAAYLNFSIAGDISPMIFEVMKCSQNDITSQTTLK